MIRHSETSGVGSVKRMFAVVVLAAVLLSGCQSFRLHTFGSLDKTERTITVPPGGGLTGVIKEALAKDGWQIAVYRGPLVTRGRTGTDTRLETANTFNTRYALFVHWQQFDVCVPRFNPAYNYDLALVDNKTGTEVLTLSGRACEHRIVDKLMEALRTTKD